MYLYLISYVAIRDVRVINVFTVIIHINAPGGDGFFKGGGGGGGATITDKKKSTLESSGNWR